LPDRFFLCPILFVCISALSPQCCAVPCAFAPSFFSSSVWLYPPLSPHPHLSTPKPVEWSYLRYESRACLFYFTDAQLDILIPFVLPSFWVVFCLVLFCFVSVSQISKTSKILK
jgi:hypothetical protein